MARVRERRVRRRYREEELVAFDGAAEIAAEFVLMFGGAEGGDEVGCALAAGFELELIDGFDGDSSFFFSFNKLYSFREIGGHLCPS